MVLSTDPQAAVFALSEADINAVAGLIKLYLRELPEPLFTNALYPRFVSGLRKYFHSFSITCKSLNLLLLLTIKI